MREHLLKIAHEFTLGEFTDPENIHSQDMPGLAVLRAAQPGQINMQYRVLPDGQLIKAIHRWFDAQLSDHARHAVGGNDHYRWHHGDC